ncbi:MAG: YihY/virulence factor BrkB family protein [Rubrobacteraceae bacterium]
MTKAEETGNRAEIPMTRGLGLVDFLKKTGKEVSDDHLFAYAGNLSYKALFALFPLFTLLLSLLGMFNAAWVVDAFTDELSAALPEDASSFINGQLQNIASSEATGAFTFGAIISVALGLWGVSGAMRSVMEAMNVMHDLEETRPFWKKYVVSLFIALLVVALVLSALVLVVFGEQIGSQVAEAIGFGSTFETLWSIAQWPVLTFLVLLAFAILYYFAPAADQRFRWISPGSLVAFAFWLIFSLIFSYYVGNSSSFETYGALAGVIILMLYFYYSAAIVLIGAEMNQIVEENAPGGKNKGEQFPDDRKSPEERTG